MVHRKRDLDRARSVHDQHVDPDETDHAKAREQREMYVRSRVEDTSRLGYLLWVIQRYSPIWGPLVVLFGALGFTVISPKRTAQELGDRIDTSTAYTRAEVRKLQVQIDSATSQREVLAHQHKDLESAITALVRMSCIDESRTPNEKRLSGIYDQQGRCSR